MEKWHSPIGVNYVAAALCVFSDDLLASVKAFQLLMDIVQNLVWSSFNSSKDSETLSSPTL